MSIWNYLLLVNESLILVTIFGVSFSFSFPEGSFFFFPLFSVANRTSVGSHPAEKPCTLYCNNTGHLFIQQGVVFLWYRQLALEESVGQRLGRESKEKRIQNPASEGGEGKKKGFTLTSAS